MKFIEFHRAFTFSSVLFVLTADFSDDSARRQVKDLYSDVGYTIIRRIFKLARKNAEYLSAFDDLEKVVYKLFMLPGRTKETLEKMNFGELRRLIDYCLTNEEVIEKHHLPLVTSDVAKILDYIEVLESKLPPKPNYLPPRFSPPIFIQYDSNVVVYKYADDLRKESEQAILDKEKTNEQKITEIELSLSTSKTQLKSYKTLEANLNKELTECQEDYLRKLWGINERLEQQNVPLLQSQDPSNLNPDNKLKIKDKKNKKKLALIKIHSAILNDLIKKGEAEIFRLTKEIADFSRLEKRRNFEKEAKNLKKELEQLLIQKSAVPNRTLM